MRIHGKEGAVQQVRTHQAEAVVDQRAVTLFALAQTLLGLVAVRYVAEVDDDGRYGLIVKIVLNNRFEFPMRTILMNHSRFGAHGNAWPLQTISEQLANPRQIVRVEA